MPSLTRVSIVTPAFNESKNLPLLLERLDKVLSALGVEWEWIIVDDHSSDDTPAVIAALSKRNPRVRGFRLARNCGSGKAITCGLHHALGDCAIVLASDLQDPPEVIPSLLEKWKAGAQVVWAARRRRVGTPLIDIILSRLYFIVVRRIIGVRNIPASGADFFALDRVVLNALRQFPENTNHLILLIAWMGFSQDRLDYDKLKREHGQSGWSFRKKIALIIDSVVAFTSMPLRLMAVMGLVIGSLGFLAMGIVVRSALVGQPPAGWASLMVVTLLLGGLQMIMMGIMGEYLWRSLDEARNRPGYLIEFTLSAPGNGLARSAEQSSTQILFKRR